MSPARRGAHTAVYPQALSSSRTMRVLISRMLLAVHFRVHRQLRSDVPGVVTDGKSLSTCQAAIQVGASTSPSSMEGASVKKEPFRPSFCLGDIVMDVGLLVLAKLGDVLWFCVDEISRIQKAREINKAHASTELAIVNPYHTFKASSYMATH